MKCFSELLSTYKITTNSKPSLFFLSILMRLANSETYEYLVKPIRYQVYV